MSTTTRHDKKRTNRNGVRQKYISLGTDANGAVHTYRTSDNAVIVVDGTSRELQRTGADVDEWMAFVDDRRGWSNREYGVSLVEALADGMEGQQ